MQKTEYTCDRCGRMMPADRMSKLDVHSVFINNPTTTKKGLERAEEILESLQRSSKKEFYRDLCDDCTAGLKDWLNTRKKEGI